MSVVNESSEDVRPKSQKRLPARSAITSTATLGTASDRTSMPFGFDLIVLLLKSDHFFDFGLDDRLPT